MSRGRNNQAQNDSFDEMIPGQSLLLFDGECGICTAFAQFAQTVDRREDFLIIPFQNFSEEQLGAHGTSLAKCAQRMHVISAQGKVHTGAFAVNYFFWRYLPWRVFVFMIYLVPVVLLFEIIMYEVVARQRRRISQWLGLTACALTPQPKN